MRNQMRANRYSALLCGLLAGLGLFFPSRLVNAEPMLELAYKDPEVTIFLTPGQPVQVLFPYVVEGVWQNKSPVEVQVGGNYITAVPPKDVSALHPEGSLRAIYLLDKRRYVVRFRWAPGTKPAPKVVRLVDKLLPSSGPVQNANARGGATKSLR